jgi:hypothetical protein
MSNLVEGRPAGAVGLGGSAQAASVGYPVGAIHFGPAWEDDSVQLTHKGWSQITDGMAKSIVRLECEADELRATIAMMEAEREIMVAIIGGLKAENAAIFAQWVSLKSGSRRATLDEIAESVREKYDEQHEGEGIEN